MDRKINPTLENLESEGIELAQALNWCGYSVMQVALAGLTESNFHSLRTRIQETVNQYAKEKGHNL
jgi:hypothetical protein